MMWRWMVVWSLCGCLRRAPTHHELARRTGEPVPPPAPAWTTGSDPATPRVQLRSAPAPQTPRFPDEAGIKVWLPGRALPDGAVLWGVVWLPLNPRPATTSPRPPSSVAPVVTPLPRSPSRRGAP